MSKMSDLDLTIKELRSAAESLVAVSDSLITLFNGNEPEADAPTKQMQAESAPTQKPVSLEQVRAVLAEKSRSGHTAKVRELLERHGANKLSEIPITEYATLLAEAEVLGDG